MEDGEGEWINPPVNVDGSVLVFWDKPLKVVTLSVEVFVALGLKISVSLGAQIQRNIRKYLNNQTKIHKEEHI